MGFFWMVRLGTSCLAWYHKVGSYRVLPILEQSSCERVWEREQEITFKIASCIYLKRQYCQSNVIMGFFYVLNITLHIYEIIFTSRFRRPAQSARCIPGSVRSNRSLCLALIVSRFVLEVRPHSARPCQVYKHSNVSRWPAAPAWLAGWLGAE